MNHLKHITILVIFIFLILCQNAESQVGSTLNYKQTGIADELFVSINVPSKDWNNWFGIMEDWSFIKLSQGIRKTQGIQGIDYIYDFDLINYISVYRVSLFKSGRDQNDNYELIDFIDPRYESDSLRLSRKYCSFFTISYEGLDITNMGIYAKEFNWSSIGFDLLYKNFFDKEKFYTKFSYIITASTMENNKYYFDGIDSDPNTKFCWNDKLMNITKFKMVLNNGPKLEFKLESYIRRFNIKSNQKEISSSLRLSYYPQYDIKFYGQIGYIKYGINEKWKELYCLTFGTNLGIIYP